MAYQNPEWPRGSHGSPTRAGLADPATHILADQYQKLHQTSHPRQNQNLNEGRLVYDGYFDITAHALSTKELISLERTLQPFVSTLEPPPTLQDWKQPYSPQHGRQANINSLVESAGAAMTGKFSTARLSSNSPPHKENTEHQKLRNSMTLRWVYGGGSGRTSQTSTSAHQLPGGPQAIDVNLHGDLDLDNQSVEVESLEGSIDLLHLARQIDPVNVRRREMEYDALLRELSQEEQERKKRHVHFN